MLGDSVETPNTHYIEKWIKHLKKDYYPLQYLKNSINIFQNNALLLKYLK